MRGLTFSGVLAYNITNVIARTAILQSTSKSLLSSFDDISIERAAS